MRNPSSLLCTVMSMMLVACSAPSKSRFEPDAVKPDSVSVASAAPTQPDSPVRELWARKLTGYITDVALSADGNVTLIAMAPNRDGDGGLRVYSVNRFNSKGAQTWSLRPSAPVKSLALSKDGKLAVVSTYDDRITAYDAAGKQVWEVEGTCKPVMASTVGRVLCYHDDDAEPGIAFDVYDLKGKRVYSFPIQNDIITLKLSEDERNLVIGLTGGKVVAFNSDFHPIWERSVPGEIADVDVSSGPQARLAVLYHRALKSRSEGRIAFFDPNGKSLGEAVPSSYAEDIEFTLDGDSVVAQGDGRQGQYVGLFPFPTTPVKSLSERWTRTVPHLADNPAPLVIAQGQVIVGLEENTGRSRANRLLSLSTADGSERWKMDVKTDEGAYLYADSVSLSSRTLVVGSDDGRLTAFRFR